MLVEVVTTRGGQEAVGRYSLAPYYAEDTFTPADTGINCENSPE